MIAARHSCIVLVVASCGRIGFDESGFKAASDGDVAASSGWHQLPTMTDPPSGRAYHSAVWTGIEMIVFGGNYDLWQRRGDGASYSPISNTWTPIASVMAPLPRGRHSAVWTGSEMLVWGGEDGLGGTAITSGRYNRATDTWGSPLSTVGAPSARFWQTTAWTGTEMIVWGGLDPTGVSAYTDGGRYRPSSDSWSSTSQGGVPTARACAVSAWTGTEMIVWGGFDLSSGGTWLGDGKRYDPVTDSWRPMSNVGAPSPRGCGSAVWTGTEMVVWGGNSNSVVFDDGARYDPATDTWSPLATEGGPVRRCGHSAVWTGTEMIVWGGDTTYGNFVFGAGASFVP